MNPRSLEGLGGSWIMSGFMERFHTPNEAQVGPTKEQTLEEMRNQGNPDYWHRAASVGGKVSATKGGGRKRQRIKRLRKKATRRKNR